MFKYKILFKIFVFYLNFGINSFDFIIPFLNWKFHLFCYYTLTISLKVCRMQISKENGKK